MRKSTFLKLVGIAKPTALSKTVFLGYVSCELISFGIENMGDNMYLDNPLAFVLEARQPQPLANMYLQS